MDFFERQDAARRRTGRLVALFALAVVLMTAAVYFLALAVIGFLSATGEVEAEPGLWEPAVLAGAVLIVALIVGGGSLYKIAQLRAGGRVIAEELGGRLISRDSADPAERRIINVVDEMAIASGIPAPPVYIMDDEPGINAFAAGFSPNDAVIGVTRGCVDGMSRDELQGVIAHEFSHILNGDMRLNIRLVGVLHGILLIGIIGYTVLRSSFYAGAMGGRRVRVGSSGGRGGGGGGAVIVMILVGVGLAIIGFIGTFIGNLIKAAVSRQREFLADAAAVEFTRNPDGIGNALRIIGGSTRGARLQSPNAPEASHLFFARAITSGFSGMFSTHPPLKRRITAVLPSWDGSMLNPRQPPTRAEPDTKAQDEDRRKAVAERFGAVGTIIAAGMLDQVGRPSIEHIEHARDVLRNIPETINQAAHEPYGARAVVYALLLDDDPDVRKTQIRHLDVAADPHVFKLVGELAPAIADLRHELRLPLMEVAAATLCQLSEPQYEQFRKNVLALVEADRKMDLFEWCLERVVIRHLDGHFGRLKPPRTEYYGLGRLGDEVAILLSALAHIGHAGDKAAAMEAFRAATRAVEGGGGLSFLDVSQCGLPALDAALDRLVRTSPRVKRSIIQACIVCVAADGIVTTRQAEVLRAIADSLGCPMPPVLPGQRTGSP